MTVYRIHYCGNCKSTWQMKGEVSMNGSRVTRRFTCPSCRKLAKIDYLTNPSLRALESRKDREPMFYDSRMVQLNKELLEQMTLPST
jgi:hypothetical protein